MLPGELRRWFARSPRREVVLHVFARRIEFGAVQGQGRAWSWAEAHGSIAIEGDTGHAGLLAVIEALRALPDDLLQGSGTEVRVVVSDAWLATVTVPWSSALMQSESADAYLRAQFALAGHELAADDRVMADDAPYGAPRLVVAYPRVLIDFLEQWVQRGKARLTSLLALSAATWNSVAPEVCGSGTAGAAGRAMAVMDEGCMLVMRGAPEGRFGRTARLDTLAVWRFPTADSEEDPAGQLTRAWRRLCMRDPSWGTLAEVVVLEVSNPGLLNQGLPAPFMSVAQGGQGDGNVAWLSNPGGPVVQALDVRPHRASWNLGRWGALGVLGFLALMFLGKAATQTTAVQAARQRIAMAEKPAPLPTRSAWSREDLARVPAVNAAIRQLNLPIEAISGALVPPRDIQVAVLSMETSSVTEHAASKASGLKLTAEACSAIDMARYVGYVAERRPFASAYLVHHEMAASTCPYRFVVEAKWEQ